MTALKQYAISNNKKVLQSIDFTINGVLMKLFKSSHIAIIEQCRCFFHVQLPTRFQKLLVIAANNNMRF